MTDFGKILITTVYGRSLVIHLADDRIEHVRVISGAKPYPVGTVLIGRVKKLIPSSHACFVSIGDGYECFMPIPRDLKEIIFTDGADHSKLKCEDTLLVQISAEAVKSKPASVSHKISLPGRYCVIEQGKGLSFSQKLSASQRKEIRLPDNIDEIVSSVHAVIRTEAENAPHDAVKTEINELFEQFKHIQLLTFCSKDYKVLFKTGTFVSQTLSEWLRFGIDEIITDDAEYDSELKDICSNTNTPEYRFYDDAFPLTKLYRLETLTDELLSKRVMLKCGGWLYIEQGETLTAIDVNSGHAVSGNKEEAVYKINLEAADEIAHVLRSRNLSGMILVDFINMKDAAHEKDLIEHMKKQLAADPVKTSYVDMTGLGLMEITRQRKYKTFSEQWKHNETS